jgi:hypothetical protein
MTEIKRAMSEIRYELEQLRGHLASAPLYSGVVESLDKIVDRVKVHEGLQEAVHEAIRQVEQRVYFMAHGSTELGGDCSTCKRDVYSVHSYALVNHDRVVIAVTKPMCGVCRDRVASALGQDDATGEGVGE